MATVFLSYRHENDAHRGRVRALGEQLRREGIEVVLDQFFFEAHPGGPREGWPAWSVRQAGKTDKVLIIASARWFRCYEGTEVPGTGRGAAPAVPAPPPVVEWPAAPPVFEWELPTASRCAMLLPGCSPPGHRIGCY